MRGRIWFADYEANGDSFTVGKPQLWNETAVAPLMMTLEGGNFDISRDGKRVLALIAPDSPQEHQNAHVTILVNFFDELKRRLP